jgi:2-dehydropantoate 2-reductase
MRIAIIGTGGVGGYFGAKLARAGNDVSFLARGSQYDAIKNNGLTIKSILGDFHLDNVNVKEYIQELGTADLALICVKAWQVLEIRADLKNLLHEHSIIIPLQNGVLAVDELSETIERKNIIGGLCRIFSKIESPGVINHFGVTPAIIFGELDGTVSNRTLEIKHLFNKAAIYSQISTNVEADMWKKFIAICVGGLMAVTRTTYGELRELKETRNMMSDLLHEIYALALKMGINIEPDFIGKTISFVDTFPYESTTSLARDIWEGKPSEIYYQNGAVVKLGKQYGIETPVNEFLFNCILPMELKARK